MLIAKVSTAISIIVGPILDSTGAEYASAVIGDLSLSKNGGTLTALAATATLTYIANGQYTLSLNTTNTNTLGMAQITCNKATYQMPTVELAIVPATVYNALMANEVNTAGGFASATGAITALAGAISTLTQTQVTGGAYALNSASFAFNAAMDFTTTQKAATLARVTLTDTVTTYTGNTPQTGDTFALIGLAGAGLTALAPAATALSTVTWTNTLATNLATTNTTVAANLDAAVSSRMATYTQPAGFLAATFPATVASPTNITAGTITTVTNLTNLPSIPLNWITAAGISAGALDGKGDWLLSSGYMAPPSAAAVASQVRTELSVELGRIDVATSTRLASTSYAAPLDAAGTRSAIGLGAANMDTQLNAIYTVAGLVQAKTDNLPATPASSADCITAAGVRTAIGMAAADLDTQLAAIYGAEQTSLANQIVMDTKLNNIKLDTAAILDDTGTTGVVISGGSGAALVASTAAQVTADHGSGSYARNTEPPTAAQIWEYATRTLTSGSGGSGATAAEVWAYTDRTLTSGGGGGLTAAEVWAYAERTLTPLALDSIMAATGLEAGRYVDTDGNPVTQINLRQAIALLLAYSLGDRSGIGTRSIISKLAGETVQIEAERISQSVIEASGTVPV